MLFGGRHVLRLDHGRGLFPGERPLIDRRGLTEGGERNVRLDHAAMTHHQPARVGGLADDREIQLPLAEDALGLFSEPGFSTISMRSWLSESIIS